MEDSELPNLGVDQGLGLDNAGQKLPDFANRPPGSQTNKILNLVHFLVLLLKQPIY